MFLDSKLNFSEHLKFIFQKTNKTIGVLSKLQTLLPRAHLITIYKSFIRSHLDQGDMIYDQTFNLPFQEKMGSCSFSNNRRNKRLLQGKALPRIRLGNSSTPTLVLKTLLFLQNTKITVCEVPLFNYFHTQYVMQNKAM